MWQAQIGIIHLVICPYPTLPYPPVKEPQSVQECGPLLFMNKSVCQYTCMSVCTWMPTHVCPWHVTLPLQRHNWNNCRWELHFQARHHGWSTPPEPRHQITPPHWYHWWDLLPSSCLPIWETLPPAQPLTKKQQMSQLCHHIYEHINIHNNQIFSLYNTITSLNKA